MKISELRKQYRSDTNKDFDDSLGEYIWWLEQSIIKNLTLDQVKNLAIHDVINF